MLKANPNLHSTPTRLLGASTLMLGILLPTALSTLPARAVDLGNGRTFFDSAPRLIQVMASNQAADVPSTYRFTISVPENAGEPLKAVTITQNPNTEQVDFEVSDSRAFEGFARGRSISLASIGGSDPDDANEVTVVFDQPVNPGNTVTVALKARNNPEFGGIYHFGVTVFPVGEDSPGLYLGSGRLHFQGSD